MSYRVAIICAVLGFWPFYAQATAPPIELSIDVEQAEQKVGNPIYLDMTFKNLTGQTITLVRGNDMETSNKIFVKDKAGLPVDMTKYGHEFYEMPHRMSGGVVPLYPGADITERVDLTSIYQMSIPGTYTVIVDRRLPQFLGGGIVESNQITVTVTK